MKEIIYNLGLYNMHFRCLFFYNCLIISSLQIMSSIGSKRCRSNRFWSLHLCKLKNCYYIHNDLCIFISYHL